MTAPNDTSRVADEQLVAYLDGELSRDEHMTLAKQIAGDPELQRRLLVLSGGNRPFKEAFEPLLAQAPEIRLASMLRNLPATRRPPGRTLWKAMMGIAAAIMIFAAGLVADRLFPILSSSFGDLIASADHAQDDDNWRQAVAEYLTLYSADTLANIPDDDTMRQRELDSLRSRLALNLSAQKAAVPGLTFKRAQLFEYEGRPLGQIAYLDPDSGPVALCMIRSDEDASPPSAERRQGFNIIYWTQDGHDYMVIGRMPHPRLRELADELSRRLAG